MYVLRYKRMKTSEIDYVIQLARDEISIEPRRLDDYQTYLIYHDRERIGFVSFGFRSDKTIYIYIMAFEKHAQRQGFASNIFESIIRYGRKKSGHFRGLSATVHKTNEAAINTTKKYGFLVTKERTKYLDFIKPVT